MYSEYFGLKESSFSITPDPQYLFLSRQHREALAHLLFGVESGSGFVLLTGEVGTGKTTVCRAFLQQIPEHVDVALVLNPCLGVDELLRTICQEFHIPDIQPDDSNKQLLDKLNQFLLDAHARSRKPLLMIDEAQNLSREVLEQIRLLTNLETDKAKLLQIFLIGQPELKALLERQDLRQLAQRITARYHLTPLNREETEAYVRHRLAVAGVQRPLFKRGAIKAIHQLSGGIPRLINVLCDRALLGAYATGQPLVSRNIVTQAARELSGEKQLPATGWQSYLPEIALLLALLVLGFLAYRYWPSDQLPMSHPPTQATVSPLQSPSGPAETKPSWPLIDYPTGMAALLNLWRQNPPAELISLPCSGFPYEGLYCRKKKGDWDLVLKYNRPVLLRIDKGYLLLEAVQGAYAISQGQRFPIVELLTRWNGDFILLWKPAPESGPLIRPDSKEVAIRWLQTALWQVAGLPEVENGNGYPVEKVRQFQRQTGLKADGIAGPDTLILLNSLLYPSDRPLLIEPRD